jgi:hypothetical protein
MKIHKTKRLACDGAFDIECANWDTFVCGAVLTDEGIEICDDESDFFAALVALPAGTYWTWGGGRYDLVWLAARCRRWGVHAEAREAGGRIVCLVVGDVQFRDGVALWPTSLREASEIAQLPKLETGLPCVCPRGCGGYCSISPTMSAALRRRLHRYLSRDVEATAAVIGRLIELAEELGITLRGTVGATAWATARDGWFLPEAEWKSSRDYAYAAKAKKGGRTQVFRPWAPVVWGFDINSCYPAALKQTPVPCGDYERLSGDAAARAWEAQRPGIYSARVVVPECHIPPLPVRGKARLVYPWGRFAGTWVRDELARAVRLGAQIERVTECMVWSREEKPMAGFCETYWGHRKRYGKKSPEGKWLKWVVNAATGKLGMRPDHEIIHVAPEDAEIRVCPADALCFGVLCGSIGCCPHKCTRKCKRWSQIDRDGEVWAAPEWRIPDCGHVQWNATLMAAGRCELGEQLEHAGIDAAYCDTDGVKATRELTRRLGEELGDWAPEGPLFEWRAWAPKSYTGIDGHTGEVVAKCKAVPGIDGRTIEAWAAGGLGLLPPPSETRGVQSLRQAARDPRGLEFRRRTLTRAHRGNGWVFGDRVWEGGDTTRALEWAEYQELARAGDIL